MEYVRIPAILPHLFVVQISNAKMIHNRLKGTRFLMGLAKLILIPCWFVCVAIVSVELLKILGYHQIAFEIYLLGIFFVFLLRLHKQEFWSGGGPTR